ncbi:hypothetical protein LX87_04357 [Larkinella arboricola]|uniref:Uncharacterized protein n=1 Tax=Larkinella arboricola TaxID=643671 RepID=A0A327WRD0_LARAB|nr:hypothetical protein [Larkinella arboricola]RAJ94470.1 hypothetical protein LX87_04357 [Larkinella arboricola]
MTTHQPPTSGILNWSFRFWWTYFVPISFWMLLAALGRAIQMRLFGPIPSGVYYGLEILVECVRIITVLVIVGHGSPRQGARKIVRLFRFNRSQWREIGRAVRLTIRQQWAVSLINLLVFSLIAFGFNKLNGIIADQSVLLPFLKRNGLVDAAATGMPVFFFLKNLTVIPFTLVFEYGLFCWLARRWPVIPKPV